MKKFSKITIKFYLNENIVAGSDQDNRPLYPLYILIIYKRGNTKIKSNYGLFYTSLDEVNSLSPGLMAFEEKSITKLIEYEASQEGGEDFTLQGIREKYSVYSTSISSAIEKYLKTRLKKEIMSIKGDMKTVLKLEPDDAFVKAMTLYQAAQQLFEGFTDSIPADLVTELKAYEKYLLLYPRPHFKYDFPTVLDWVNGEFRTKLDQGYENAFSKKDKDLKSIYLLIEKAINMILKEAN